MIPRAVHLTDRGLALCDFAFRDGPALGLGDKESMAVAQRLIEQWDGSETLLQIYRRLDQWPETITDVHLD